MVPDSKHDVMIVGSGPAGVAAALAFSRNGIVPTMLDVGLERTIASPEINSNFFDYAATHDVNDLIVGKECEGLYNLNPTNQHISFNLTVPKNRFVVEQTDQYLPLLQNNISVVQSLARGGLANAWGAAAFRYDDRDLQHFPIDASDLEPFYDILTKEIGINGQDDDLSRFYGSLRHLQPGIRVPINSSRILRTYKKRKDKLNQLGLFAGHMRSAILTKDLGERKAHPYLNTDLFASLTCTYSPVYTLDRLLCDNRVKYVSGVLVERWSRDGESICIHGKHVNSDAPATFRCQTLILAAGAINSTKIALRSFDDYLTRLPIADNPVAYLPFLLPGRLGKRLDLEGYGSTAIACVYDFDGFSTHLNAPIFETMTVPRAEFYRHMPFNASMNAMLMKQILPAMVVMLIYFPSDCMSTGTIGINSDGRVVLNGPDERAPLETIKRVIRLNRFLGMYSHHSLADRTIYGGSIHYVGMLPMRRHPSGRYETDQYGELKGQDNVFVVDGAALPCVSSKNQTLTIMANSMRICTRICEQRFEQPILKMKSNG